MDKNIVGCTEKSKGTSKVFSYCNKISSMKMVLLTSTVK